MRSYPHMCRDRHFEVGYKQSASEELCPVCEANGYHIHDLLELERCKTIEEFKRMITEKIAHYYQVGDSFEDFE